MTQHNLNLSTVISGESTFTTTTCSPKQSTLPKIPSPKLLSTFSSISSSKKFPAAPKIHPPPSSPAENKKSTSHFNSSLSKTFFLQQKLQHYYGTYPSHIQLISQSAFGKPSKLHTFSSQVTFDHIILFLFKSNLLPPHTSQTLQRVHPLYAHLYLTITRLQHVDFRSISTTVLGPHFRTPRI